MKVKSPSGREYYIQRAKDDRMANWCSRVTPVRLEFDGRPAEAYADPDRSDWIYIRFDETIYCNWAKREGGFDLMNETTLRISDPGRAYRKRASFEPAESDEDDVQPSARPQSNDRELTREDLDAVVAYLPALSEAVAARANDPGTSGHEYSSDFSSLVRRIVKEFHSRQFMYAFDYMAWMDEAERLMGDRDALATADLEALRKLLVVHWRRDYWDNDHTHWESIAANGHLAALLERMRELADGMEPSSDPPSREIALEDEDEEATEPQTRDDDDGGNVWPTVDELIAGCDRIRDKITPQQMTMLQVNYYSGGRAATMRELATAAGYGDYKIANVQYGSLAKRLYKAIGYPKPESADGGEAYWVFGLGEFVDRSDFGLEMQCVMHAEVAEALEALGIVDAPESDEPNAVYAWELDDLSEILPPMDDAEINDFIVYHNPDAMGPLEPSDDFGVVTNRGLGPAKVGDRVWLITGEGTPRKYYLAKWFYIDEFASGEGEGFKHVITGVDGENFDPFVEIAQDEWFTQLKQDQGNFAFGFSRINTPGAVEGLKTLAGILEIADEASPKGCESVSLADLAVLARLHSHLAEVREYVRANPDDSSDYIPSTVSVMEITLNRMGIYVEFDVEAWTDEATRLSGDAGQIGNADLLTLRKLLTYHRHQSQDPEYPDQRDLGYWIDFALKGELLAILGRFEELYQSAIQDRMNEILHGSWPVDDDHLSSAEEGLPAEPWLDEMQEIVNSQRVYMRMAVEEDKHLIQNATSKLLAHLRSADFLIDVEADTWVEEANRLVDPHEVEKAGLATIRGVLSHYLRFWMSDESSVCLDLAEKGYFLRILDRMHEIFEGPAAESEKGLGIHI